MELGEVEVIDDGEVRGEHDCAGGRDGRHRIDEKFNKRHVKHLVKIPKTYFPLQNRICHPVFLVLSISFSYFIPYEFYYTTLHYLKSVSISNFFWTFCRLYNLSYLLPLGEASPLSN
jgi:hypothetical protein